VLDYETVALWIHQKPDQDVRICASFNCRSPARIIAQRRSQTTAATRPSSQVPAI